MQSVWSDTVKIPEKPTMEQDFHTDVLIIGGGMAGILCALRLQQAGIPYTLIEADTVCGGITKNTTGKITSQHGLVYTSLIRRFGAEYARMYLEINEMAREEYKKLCRNTDCDFEERDAAVYSLNDRDKIEKEIDSLWEIGFTAEFSDELPLPFPIAGAVRFPKQAQFHPLKFVAATVPELNIFEHTRALEFTGRGVQTNHGIIHADKIIVATHFPFLNKHGSYFLKQYQHRSYVIAYSETPDVGGMYVDAEDSGMSFRNYKDLLLIGGGGGRTGKPHGGWKELTAFAESHYPQAKECYRFAAQDCMTLDEVPYIGTYSKHTPNLYVATGFQKWGMTSSMAAAMVLCDLVSGNETPFARLFSPSRSILHPQLAVNALEAACNLLTPRRKRCPHLGCALKWNEEEQSYDCPCHGSRFAEDGKLLDNPATGNLQNTLPDEAHP